MDFTKQSYNRRDFLKLSALTAGMSALGKVSAAHAAEPAIKQPPLPYGVDALAPVLSANALGFHYGKHHKGYVDTVNRLIAGTEYEHAPLEQIIKKTAANPAMQKIFNNAAQAWNHAFLWQSMRPGSHAKPAGMLAQRVDAAFGSFDKFKTAFATAAIEHFGSGWAWLIQENGGLKVTSTANADTPIARGQIPLLTIDVWEHAYYLDYQNRRADYVNAVIDRLLNWDFAAANASRASV